MSRQIEPSEFWENVAFSVLLIIALWNLLQISYDYKWLVFLIITPIAFNTIFAFRETYQYKATELTHRKVFLQLIALFILSPFILWGLKIISTYRYLEVYPADNLLSYKISVNWIVNSKSDRFYKVRDLLNSAGDKYPSVPCKRMLLNQ